MKIFVLLKKNILMFVFISFAFFLIIFSNSNLIATKNGLNLWANNVIPSLFPFFVATELLQNTSIVYYLSYFLSKYMKPLFNVPGCSAFAFIMGIISGYPIGSKIVTNLYETNQCTKPEAERMLCFTNNSGPLFIIGTIGSSFYKNSTFGIVLLITHILSAITVGIIFGKFSKHNKVNNNSYNSKYNRSINNYYYKKEKHQDNISFNNLGIVLSNSIISSIKSILLIGGFVTLFSVVISILNQSRILLVLCNTISNILHIDYNLVNGFITGLIEFTNGLYIISNVHQKNISINIILSSFILAFGGLSITMQVLSIISRSKLSIRKYLFAKILHGLIAAFYTFIILSIPLFNYNI